jgi:hypothetical protein
VESTLVRVRRDRASAAPAVLVATRLIGALGRARRVELDRADDDLIVLRVWPGIRAPGDGQGDDELFAELETLLRSGPFAGWESEPTD